MNDNITMIDELPDLDDIEVPTPILPKSKGLNMIPDDMSNKYQKNIRNSHNVPNESGMYSDNNGGFTPLITYPPNNSQNNRQNMNYNSNIRNNRNNGNNGNKNISNYHNIPQQNNNISQQNNINWMRNNVQNNTKNPYQQIHLKQNYQPSSQLPKTYISRTLNVGNSRAPLPPLTTPINQIYNGSQQQMYVQQPQVISSQQPLQPQQQMYVQQPLQPQQQIYVHQPQVISSQQPLQQPQQMYVQQPQVLPSQQPLQQPQQMYVQQPQVPVNHQTIHSKENFLNNISCLQLTDHVKSCPVCLQIYKNDNKTGYIITIFILILICIILLKKVFDL
jgi:hypothetical protein